MQTTGIKTVMRSIEYRIGGFHRFPMNFFSLMLSAIVFQLFFMSPQNLVPFCS